MTPAKPNPASINFAALDTLRLVDELQSFTAAAEKLQVNQSAVSYTIAKLRACFHDPLFVREGGQQVATERCKEILAKSLQMLEMLDEMAQPEVFDPRLSERNITIACNYYERILLVPDIIAAIRRQAPHMTVKVINALGDGHLRLLNREADVLVGPFARTESGFHSRRLYVEEYACLMDPSHPLADGQLDIARYLDLNHVLIDYGGGWKSAYLQELEAAGHTLTPTVAVPSPAGLATLLAGSDLVATIPRRLGERSADHLVVAESPFPGRFDLSIVWAAHTNGSAMHRWLRNTIWETCRG
ncbi:Transcriptional regulator, LysR family [Sinorhizobium sojae CCBAU 05684]|uniref:Transcriptional regulator, LysR family n=2 Tax=Sinorhizobium sojae TaxID=716925 RepID=A0A249PFY5_9HYPH|nr:Transcriptional regulator, LysR family [Sinorhizobium sojae CCBAU 05684]